MAKEIHKRAEKDYKRLAAELGYQGKDAFVIRLSRAGKDYASIQPYAWTPHPWVAGLAYPREGVMTLRLPPGQGFDKLYQTFVHELSHLLLFRAASFQSMPLWFVEATAMLQSQDYTQLDRYLLIGRARASGSLPALSSLQRRFPTDGAGAHLAYAVSFEYLQFLRTYEPEIIPRILESLRKGQAFELALARILPPSATQIEKAWQAHLAKHYPWWTGLAHEGFFWLLLCLLLPLFYFRQRKLQRLRLQALEDEDAAYTTPQRFDLSAKLNEPDDTDPPENASPPTNQAPRSLSYRELRQQLDASPTPPPSSKTNTQERANLTKRSERT